MVRPDMEKSFLRSVDELSPTGKGFAVVQSGYDSTQERNDGITDPVPSGFEVRYLGEGSIAPGFDFPFGEFLVWDPTKVEITLERIEGVDDEQATEIVHRLRAEGYMGGETRPFHRHTIVWGQRPALIRAEIPTTA